MFIFAVFNRILYCGAIKITTTTGIFIDFILKYFLTFVIIGFDITSPG